jgi:hypothetical protein
MCFWPVNEMIELVLYLFIFLILRTSNLSSLRPAGTRTPGWIPLILRVALHFWTRVK